MRNLRQPVASGSAFYSLHAPWTGQGQEAKTRNKRQQQEVRGARRRKSNFTASFLKTNKSVGSKGAFRHRMAWHNRNEL